MSTHIGAEAGAIEKVVLLPGDPLRAKRISETFRDPFCHNLVRGMLGYTGMATLGDREVRVSVHGSGMGIPSVSIVAEELIRFYGAKILIRVGTCGSYQEDVKLGDIVLAQCASTDSNFISSRFRPGDTFAASADFGLLTRAHKAALKRRWPVRVGNIVSTDTFYDPDKNAWKRWARYGAIAVEMEAAALYTIAAYHSIRALTILTVSDSLVTGEKMSSLDRETCFPRMVKLALSAAFTK